MRERVAGMQRARRVASIAVIAMVGAVALAGCRSEPGIAAYYGDQKITEDQVTSVVDDARRRLAPSTAPADAASPSPDPALPPGAEQPAAPTRQDVVTVLLLGAVCEKLRAERGYQPADDLSPEQVASLVGAPADSAYARDAAKLYTCLESIPDQSVTPSQEDLNDLVARARTAPDVVPPGTPDDVVINRLGGDPSYLPALSDKRTLEQAAADYDVTVNPRYRPLEFPVLRFRGNIAAISVSLGGPGPGTVVDPR